ncbi:hypothetical protein SGFS_031180 [Streptomyces graminofaciens]|uniref:HTH luxR-type domain-containing protein n=1 Tax=Streptomyces graminofaciens TaxID=68212 RepID=A0ABM7F7B2_9ACTN|nr:LuxR family transcriptional regulator [Streptomyces graminofaciens]BBC31824.1 hypothetical protein SGFS_031180 [Streptomyces graminofaciens]
MSRQTTCGAPDRPGPCTTARPGLLPVGRDKERRLLEKVLPKRHDITSSAAVVLLEGRFGLGRTTLLRWAAATAERHGAQVLAAHCSRTESDFPYGAVTQLLAPLPSFAPKVSELLRFHPPADPCARTRWLAPALLAEAAERPLLLVLDDAQWADAASLHVLTQTIRQLRDTRVTVLVATTPDDRPDSLRRLLGLGALHRGRGRTDRLLRLGPLGPEAFAEMLAAHGWPAPVDPALAAEVTRLCRGNPKALDRALAACGADRPTGGEVTPEALQGPATAALAELADRAVEHLPDEAQALLRAYDVAAGALETEQVVRLAGLSVPAGARAQTLLNRLDLLTDGDRPVPTFPGSVRLAFARLNATEREELHARAAELCYRTGVRASRIAGMLIAAPSFRPPWALEVLCSDVTAPRPSEEAHSPIHVLEHSLLRTEAPMERLGLHIQLALASITSNPIVTQRQLDTAYRLSLSGTDPVSTRIRLHAADILTMLQGPDALADATVGQFQRGVPPQAGHPWREPSAPRSGSAEGPDAVDPLPGPARAALRAWQLAAAGVDQERAMALARQALCGAPPPPGITLFTPTLAGVGALMLSEDVKDIEEAVLSAGAVVDDALFAGARFAALHGLLLRAQAYRRLGRTDLQIADLKSVAELSDNRTPHPRLLPLLSAAHATLLRLEGHLAAAEHVLAVDLPEVREESMAMSAFLSARAKVYEATGRFEEALADLMSVGRGLSNRGWHNPALLPWRARAATLAERLGKRAFASRLFAEERRLASAWAVAGTSGDSGSVDPSRLSPTSRAGEAERAYGRERGPDPSPGAVALTPAESRVAELAAEGLSNKLVAERLSISPRTVELHLTRAYRKLGISGRAGLRAALASVCHTKGDGRAA